VPLCPGVRMRGANREIVLGNALLSTQSHPVTRRSENPNTGGLEVIDISSRDKMLFRGPSLASPLGPWRESGFELCRRWSPLSSVQRVFLSTAGRSVDQTVHLPAVYEGISYRAALGRAPQRYSWSGAVPVCHRAVAWAERCPQFT
jgi:hypothetical protein